MGTRLLVMSLFFCLILAGILFVWTFFTDPSKTYDFFSSFSGSTAVDKVPPSAFVPPKGTYRVWFPAKTPGELNDFTKYMRQTPLPSPQYFVGDRDLGYFATSYETNLAAIAPGDQRSTGMFLVNPTGTPTASNVSVASTFDPMQISKFLDTKCDEIVKTAGGTTSNKYPLALGGGLYPGRYAEGTFKNTGNAFRMEIFLDQKNKKIVAVSVVGKPKRVFSPQASKFMQTVDMWN